MSAGTNFSPVDFTVGGNVNSALNARNFADFASKLYWRPSSVVQLLHHSPGLDGYFSFWAGKLHQFAL
jgi:hypothetical protein